MANCGFKMWTVKPMFNLPIGIKKGQFSLLQRSLSSSWTHTWLIHKIYYEMTQGGGFITQVPDIYDGGGQGFYSCWGDSLEGSGNFGGGRGLDTSACHVLHVKTKPFP